MDVLVVVVVEVDVVVVVVDVVVVVVEPINVKISTRGNHFTLILSNS